MTHDQREMIHDPGPVIPGIVAEVGSRYVRKLPRRERQIWRSRAQIGKVERQEAEVDGGATLPLGTPQSIVEPAFRPGNLGDVAQSFEQRRECLGHKVVGIGFLADGVSHLVGGITGTDDQCAAAIHGAWCPFTSTCRRHSKAGKGTIRAFSGTTSRGSPKRLSALACREWRLGWPW